MLEVPELDRVGVSQEQSRGGESPPLTISLWSGFAWCSPGYSWFSGLQAHIAGSCWASCQPTPPSASPQDCSQSIPHPSCISAWDCLTHVLELTLDLVQLHEALMGPSLTPACQGPINEDSSIFCFLIACLFYGEFPSEQGSSLLCTGFVSEVNSHFSKCDWAWTGDTLS